MRFCDTTHIVRQSEKSKTTQNRNLENIDPVFYRKRTGIDYEAQAPRQHKSWTYIFMFMIIACTIFNIHIEALRKDCNCPFWTSGKTWGKTTHILDGKCMHINLCYILLPYQELCFMKSIFESCTLFEVIIVIQFNYTPRAANKLLVKSMKTWTKIATLQWEI